MLPEDLTPEQFSKKPAVVKALNDPRSPSSVLNYMCGCDINNPNDFGSLRVYVGGGGTHPQGGDEYL